VGDDWQSIYGFRGSNVDYTVNFKNHFKGAEVIKLTKNYRSMPTIVEAGNHVISHNEHKVDKTVLAHKEGQTKIHLYSGKDELANVEYVADAVRQLYEQDYQKEDILILHRRSVDYALYYEYFKEMGLEVQHSTIHAAKGLEARAVFILGLHDMPGGFPEVWSTDRIYQLIKTTDLKALMEEERRLFYVAITRAKDELFLLSIKGAPSAFLKEIPPKYISKSKKVALLKKEQVYQCMECHTLCEQDVNYCPNCGAPNYF
jgi:DNA helicase-4